MARATSLTVPWSNSGSAASRATSTSCPIATPATRDASTRTSRRKAPRSSSRISGDPGVAMLPGSTSFSVTTPAKGAVITAKLAVTVAASLPARALARDAWACCTRASMAATRASAARSAAVASSSSWVVADLRPWSNETRACDAFASARPASAAWRSAPPAVTDCSAARAADCALRACAPRSRSSRTTSTCPARTWSPGATRTSRTGAISRLVTTAVVLACTRPPASTIAARGAFVTACTCTVIGSRAATASTACSPPPHAAVISATLDDQGHADETTCA